MITIKRPIWYSIINNPECQEPVITLKRDGALSLKDTEFDMNVSLSNLSLEVGKRNDGSAYGSPIKVQIEYKFCWNVVVIETVAVDNYKTAKVLSLSLPILPLSLSLSLLTLFYSLLSLLLYSSALLCLSLIINHVA